MTRTQWWVRQARPEEAELLTELALRSKAMWGYPPEFMQECRPLLTVTPQYILTHPVFVGEDDAGVAGFCSLQPRAGDIELGLFFVEPARSRQGLGRALMQRALEHATSLGHHRVVIESDPQAEGFYLRAGARRIGTVPSSLAPGRELPLLELELR